VLGAGNYANATFLPAGRSAGRVDCVGIASAAGLTARHAAQKFGFNYATSSDQEVLQDEQVKIVAILTRHNLHAAQTISALKNQKAVYCEKPLAISENDLSLVQDALMEAVSSMLMVGYNRRFAPFSLRLKDFLSDRSEPMVIHYRVNAGFIPLNHWVHDPLIGGGRLIGEGCHFIDYLSFLTGNLPIKVKAYALPDNGRYHQDNFTLNLTYPDGSIGTVTYLANGDKSFPKERVEVFCGGKVAVLDDYRSLELTHSGRTEKMNARLRQDKGHRRAWEAFIDAVITGKQPPIPYDQIFGVSTAAFAAVRSLKNSNEEFLS
jgi:predicted dehydrogenase